MAIEFSCESCGKRLTAKNEHAGKRAKCLSAAGRREFRPSLHERLKSHRWSPCPGRPLPQWESLARLHRLSRRISRRCPRLSCRMSHRLSRQLSHQLPGRVPTAEDIKIEASAAVIEGKSSTPSCGPNRLLLTGYGANTRHNPTSSSTGWAP